jgi:hypothetical protein
MSNLEIQEVEQNEVTKDAGVASALDELIRQQNVFPADDLDAFSELWPVDDDPDELLRFLLEERAERRRVITERELLDEHSVA